ncbi:MAG: lipopolysaccharide core heptose(I) kinase RfaP [Sedimentisphaerales bacterium]|nr:lipopolysaccharide core heptose(I) kinase RfaP [Sedimentisphaerales bacterium]
MIYIHPDHSDLFSRFHTVDDFLKIDIDIVRDFKNRKTGRFEMGGRGFYIKKHFECGLGAVLDEFFHLRKPHIGAEHERIVLDKLHTLGIDTMQVAAFGREGKTLTHQRSFLVTEELTHVQSLEAVCGQWPTTPPPAAFKKALIGQIARIAKILHSNGLNHRDFYLCHFLLDTTDQTDNYQKNPPKLFLIDLHRAQQRSFVPLRWRIKDIGGLYFSAMDIGLTKTDLLRFMSLYAGKPLRQTLQEDKSFWQAVQQRALRTYRKEFEKLPTLTNGKS